MTKAKMKGTIKLDAITPHPNNPRIISPEKIKELGKSIKDFEEMMEVRGIVVDENNIIIGGNQRYAGLLAYGYTSIPGKWITKVTGWSEERKQEFMIKDNAPVSGDWDFELLADWDEDKLNEWGMEFDFTSQKEVVEDDYEIPDEIETNIKIGDIIEIGNHRLMCGDSTKKEDVEKLMNGKKAELLFTSPPYLNMREYEGNKNLSVSSLINFISSFEPYSEYQVINLGIKRKDNEIVQYWDGYIEKAKECGYKFLSWNIWSRDEPKTMSHQKAFFPIAHEWLFVFGKEIKELIRTKKSKGGGKFQKSTHIPEKVKGEINTKGIRVTNKYVTNEYKKINTVNTIMVANSGEHPAMFPVELPSEYIKAMTNKLDIIADSFLGSGTTMVAAHQLNRKCYGMELDEKYCQITIDRMLKLDSTLTVKINGEAYLEMVV